MLIKNWSKGIFACLAYVFTFVCCATNQPNEDEGQDASDRYRTAVHAIFSNKAACYDADARYLIIVDYSIPSNHNRLFLWDTECDGIVEAFWCAHGLGGNSTPEKPDFSNAEGSYCSSLGWYLVDRPTGVSIHYGYSYHAVDGLDTTNSNARRRQILIHPWPDVSNDEANQIETPMRLDGRCAGCFTISARGYEVLDSYIKSRPKRLLLWAIDGIE